ncbi:hypothetical protein ACX3VT_02230 [Aerococcus sanguinicola]|uniref:hypothetical protein n=1 Tax=unclassified Aerococcus TaxID=2618060 RepID=UPI0008A33B89|nr:MULTISPECIES: hypothetical protein [unclassified Aerococcus]KAB0646634.1 hypothetical protein F6I01_06290 [Aerococcus sanguinicola]MDK6233946.1 hypothetical protein [Aerococcus sp. UMB10185]MDK6856337.1 hypothetical protein [Aerococcus sp. UMB7533]MDK8502692.1 hypothetical protein [Aerococcus sp. UMB1112A]OFN04166.1 hypothetical protein HMPREF2626_04505 [Aerococcus sp. HMSC062A02]
MKRNYYSLGIGGLMALVALLLELLFPDSALALIFGRPAPFATGWPYWLYFVLIMGLAFTLMTKAYDLIDLRLPGNAFYKTVVYVACELLLWLLYTAEPLPHLDLASLTINLLKGFIIFLVQYQLIRRYLATERYHYQRKAFLYWRGIAVFTASFAVFRTLGNLAFDLYQLPRNLMAFSILWASLMGFALGLVFCFLQRYLSKQDKKGKTFQFSFNFFSPLVISYHLFLVLSYDLDAVGILIRIGLDILAVLVASWIVSQWQIDEFIDYDQADSQT